MDLQEQFSQEIFRIGNFVMSLGQLMEVVGIIGFFVLLGYVLLAFVLPRFDDRLGTSTDLKPRARKVILTSIILVSVITILRTLNIDFLLWPLSEEDINKVSIRISNVVMALLLISIANLFDFIFADLLAQWAQRKSKESGEPVKSSSHFRLVEAVLYTLILIFEFNDIGLSDVGVTLNSGSETRRITIGGVLLGLLIFFFIRLILRLFQQIVLARYYRNASIDEGSKSALNQLLTYLAYVIGFLILLQTAGFNLIALWTGAAALLVGIGIGLQQIFNDLICGIIILFERTVKVGDIVDMGGVERTGTVRRIGARTSHVETRDGILVYVPNSKLIGDSVVNWSQTEQRARFHVGVGVAYGSDTELVKNILLEVVDKHPRVMKRPLPMVRFKDFGDSSLDFEVVFWSRDFLRIEDTKSDLRFAIDKRFREAKIEIPFPQRDLWVRGIKGRIGIDTDQMPTPPEQSPE